MLGAEFCRSGLLADGLKRFRHDTGTVIQILLVALALVARRRPRKHRSPTWPSTFVRGSPRLIPLAHCASAASAPQAIPRNHPPLAKARPPQHEAFLFCVPLFGGRAGLDAPRLILPSGLEVGHWLMWGFARGCRYTCMAVYMKDTQCYVYCLINVAVFGNSRCLSLIHI